MKRFLQLIPAAVAIVLLAASCQKTPTGGSKKLSLSRTSVNISASGQTVDFLIIAKADWSLTEDSDWITADETSGKAGSTMKVVLTVDPNEGETERTGTVTITAAGESDPYVFTVRQNGMNVLTGVNKWMYETLEEWYYWNDAVKAATPPSNSLEYDEFLSTLLLDLDGAKDTDTNPATIDGGYYSNGSRYVYSYIVRNTAATRATSEETIFGFDVQPFYISDADNRIGFIVRWVQPGGPAELAGIKRGSWIFKYDGKDIYAADYEKFWYQLHYLQGGATMSLTDDSGNVIPLTAATMKVSPIIYDNVVSSPDGKKVAYLVYNRFERGDTGSNGDGEYDDELRAIFGEFKDSGATELVIDLRYNGGGYVRSCQILTSLAGNVGGTDIFAKLLRNDDLGKTYKNPEVANFLNEPNSLKLDKVYVIATGDSASASEMVISTLRGVLGDAAVVHIGTVTEGKNVGMDLLTTSIGAYSYEMWPITFKIMNAKNFCDYAGGFTPNYLKDEYWDIKYTKDSVLHELGDPEERLLNAALTLIDGGTVTGDTAPSTRAAEKQPAQTLRDPRQGGAKYTPNL